jgi:hypothetical protein
MQAPAYFDRQGNPLHEKDARDSRGILKDGVRVRVPMQMRDSANRFTDGRSFWDAHRDSLQVTDIRALGGTEGNKPGFRILDSAANRQAINDAYRQYNDDLTNAWKTPPTGVGSQGARGSPSSNPPPGAYPYSAAAEGAACTVNGRPGRLVRAGNSLVCQPTTEDARARDDSKECPFCEGTGEIDGEHCLRCGGSGEIDTDDEEETADAATATKSDRTLSLDQMRVNHARNMNRIYDQIMCELQNAWREGK